MAAASSKHNAIRKLVNAAVRGELTKDQALRVCEQEPEIVALALLAAGQCIAELQSNPRDPGASAYLPRYPNFPIPYLLRRLR